MASVYKHKSRGWYVAVTLPSRTRRQIYLGNVNRAAALNVARRLDSLMASNRIGEPPAADVAAWLACVDPKFLERLAELGLLQQFKRRDAGPTLAEVWQTYVGNRTDFSDGTRRGWGTAWKHVGAAFPDATLESITVADAKQFARDLLDSMASTHARQIISRTRQIFNHAIEAELVATNPFRAVRISGRADKARQFYVSPDLAMAVMAGFTSADGRALFALARFCGLRVPHEPLALTWRNVDWEKSRLTIPHGTKTGSRVVPLFPPALAELGKLCDAAPDGATWIFDRARGSAGTSWRNWLESAIAAAHVPPWSKLWHNLRASCRTDLENRFPSHVCDAWLGHSAKVAADHYLMVTPEHWDAAGKLESVRRGE